MKAAVLDALGAAPRYGDFTEPSAAPGETIVHAIAAAIKPIDRAIAAGTHYSSPRSVPVACGIDGVGRLDDGSRVYFMATRQPFGAMAERAPATLTVPLPDGMDEALAAAVVNPALAAWLPLVWRGRLAQGENVMVLGATGAAGRLAVKAARLLGARRVVAAGRRQDVLAELDADATIDLRLSPEELGQAFAEEAAHGIHVIVDYVWGAPVEALLANLGKADSPAGGSSARARLVSVGTMAGRTITLPSTPLRSLPLELLGSGTGNFPPPERMASIVGDILSRAAAGELTMEIERFDLDQVKRAWAAAETSAMRPVLMVSPA